jgi:hypothetical protein
MKFKTIKEWKQGIREEFKKNGYDYAAQNLQADAFEDMYKGDKVDELPSPAECFEAECNAGQY